jgi:hypothetical protein
MGLRSGNISGGRSGGSRQEMRPDCPADIDQSAEPLAIEPEDIELDGDEFERILARNGDSHGNAGIFNDMLLHGCLLIRHGEQPFSGKVPVGYNEWTRVVCGMRITFDTFGEMKAYGPRVRPWRRNWQNQSCGTSFHCSLRNAIFVVRIHGLKLTQTMDFVNYYIHIFSILYRQRPSFGMILEIYSKCGLSLGRFHLISMFQQNKITKAGIEGARSRQMICGISCAGNC